MPELGTSAGFTLMLKDNAGLGHAALLDARNQLLGMAAQSKLLANVRPNGMEDTPQLRVDVDPAKAEALGVPPERVFKTLFASLDGALVVGVVPVTGQLDLKALARALGRDVKRVHEDVAVLLAEGVLERDDDRKLFVPYATIHVSFDLMAKAA